MTHRSDVFRMMARAAGVVGLLLLAGRGAVAAPADPEGTWLTEDGRARIRVEHCGAKLEKICGFVVWMQDAKDEHGQLRKDESNPDHSKRSRPLLGHQLIMGLTPNDKGRFEGQIYDAENGKTYAITLWRPAAEELKMKGCMLSILCGSQTWAQTTDMAPGQLSGPTGTPTGPRIDADYAPLGAARK